MTYTNIKTDHSNFSQEERDILSLSEHLLSNINSVKGVEHSLVKLSYDGSKFTVLQTGYQHHFLLKDIDLAILGDFAKHNDFIINTFQRMVDDYLSSSKSINDKHLLSKESSSIFKYYGFDSDLVYPKYQKDPRFLKTLSNIKISIDKLLK